METSKHISAIFPEDRRSYDGYIESLLAKGRQRQPAPESEPFVVPETTPADSPLGKYVAQLLKGYPAKSFILHSVEPEHPLPLKNNPDAAVVESPFLKNIPEEAAIPVEPLPPSTPPAQPNA